MRPFSARHRAADYDEAAAGVLDVLVIGMGATGAGVALDAATRGLSVAVIDRADLAAGTSSKSSKLVHGGLRYLENYEFGLVREGVLERQLLQRLAPHLVRPMDFIYPIWPDSERRRLLGLGLTTYDVFAGMRNVRRHAKVTAAAATALAPALADSGLRYAYTYGDCATDDARLVLAVVQTARAFGAWALTYTEATGLLRSRDGRVCGATVRDRLDPGSAPRELRARHVVNATGVWVDDILRLDEPSHRTAVQPSKGVHLVVPRSRLPLDSAAVLLPSRQGDGRSMFAIPWGAQTILGTTDTAYAGSLDDLSLDQADLDYVLAATNAVFRTGLAEADVLGAWAGVRPLLRPAKAVGAPTVPPAPDGSGAPRTAAPAAGLSAGGLSAGGEPAGGEPAGGEPETLSDLSRRHTLISSASGLITITGGKLTTYRRMAAEVVDLIVSRDGRRARCRTDAVRLAGAGPAPEQLTAELAVVAHRLGLATAAARDVARSLVQQAGTGAAATLSLAAADHAYAAPLSPHTPHLLAEVVQAARWEGAATLDDVLARRTRVSLREQDAGLTDAPVVVAVLAAELGRDAAWAVAEVARYRAAVARERGVLGAALPAVDPARVEELMAAPGCWRAAAGDARRAPQSVVSAAG